ncbi:unnamed protein product, partial [Nesidiocoris tenuis]
MYGSDRAQSRHRTSDLDETRLLSNRDELCPQESARKRHRKVSCNSTAKFNSDQGEVIATITLPAARILSTLTTDRELLTSVVLSFRAGSHNR